MLGSFIEYVKLHLRGDEKGEAQIFLERLFQAFGQGGVREAGAVLEHRIKKDSGGTAFADLVWKPIVLIEMKKRGEDLSRHLQQAFDYWVRLVPDRPQYVVLCNFDEFWVYDFDIDINEPQDIVRLDELASRYGPLAFLFPTGEPPTFKVDRLKVTREAADLLSSCFRSLAKRDEVGRETAQRFILQMLVSLFSEDILLLPKYFVTNLLKKCDSPSTSFDLLGGLFSAMATDGGAAGGKYKDIAYFNGGLFDKPAPIELTSDEVFSLRQAAEYDWSHVSPDVFGTIFQHSMDEKERHALGAHYTTPADIMKIVQPTIVRPWREAIARATTRTELRHLQQRLYTYRVLDPACGSGNFLYIAYRALKRLEVELLQRMDEVSTSRDTKQREFGFVSSKQFFGMDIIPFAVELAKVTMTLAHKLSIDELHINEPALPLDNLDANIRCMDALIESEPANLPGDDQKAWRTPLLDEHGKATRADWPAADVIIGNPPFNSSKKLKPDFGPGYVNALRKAYPGVPGMADYCVNWFRRSHDEVPVCTPDDPLAGRVGLVGTQNIRNNKSRVGGLDHVAASGVIVEAVENQPWSGEANVHVSIANWVKLGIPHVADGEGGLGQASVGGDTINAKELKTLLIPYKRRLWTEVDPTVGQASGGKRKRTKISGKRGNTRKDKSFELRLREVDNINSALSDDIDLSAKHALSCNKKPKRCFQGKIPGYSGFMLNAAQIRKMDSNSMKVVYPYLIGRELLDDFHIDRWVIDFRSRGLVELNSYPAAFAHLQKKVLPYVRHAADIAVEDNKKSRKEHLDRWWQFWNRRDQLNVVFETHDRIIACSRVTRRPIVTFISNQFCPGDLIQMFAFDDDYSFGILQSEAHFEWFRKASKLKIETDCRYSVREVFETLPWPQSPSKTKIRAVAEASREVRRLRDEILPTMTGGLRALYRSLELPGKHPLKDAHAALDAVVLAAYGFDPKGDRLAQLLELNLTVAAKEQAGEPVTAPGVPQSYGDPSDLITEDCIAP